MKPFEIRGLRQSQLDKVRRLTRYAGPTGETFFQEAVWWWNPLRDIIGPRGTKIGSLSSSDQRFFPREIFDEIKESMDRGDLHELLNHWFELELEARLNGIPDHWPAFLAPVKSTYMGLTSDEVHIADFAERIDLRKPDSVLIAGFRRALKILRAERRERIPWPVDDRKRRSSYLSRSSFARIELIDRKISLKESVSPDEWANVNKAVRKLRDQSV
jgi:hypothetical protein